MNAIDWTPLYRNSIGFDRLATMLNSAMRTESVSGTPPYNIEMIDQDQYAITLAVAGFEQSDLDIEVAQQVLIVKGSKTPDDERKYLYQGIASSSFERKFSLAEHVEVTDARLSNGLLTIHMKREIPEAMKPRTIPIGYADSVSPDKPELIQNEAA
jgi:molecular chaperone IbpA